MKLWYLLTDKTRIVLSAKMILIRDTLAIDQRAAIRYMFNAGLSIGETAAALVYLRDLDRRGL